MGMSREEFVARMTKDMAKRRAQREKEYNDYIAHRITRRDIGRAQVYKYGHRSY